MFQKVDDAKFLLGEHDVLRYWAEHDIFRQLQQKNAGKKKWSFLDGPITANNPMGVHHAWGRTYKDVYQRYHAMTGHELRYQNGFDCQGLWVEVEVEKQLKLGSKNAIEAFGIDTFTRECKRRVLKFAARQTEQSIRLGYWMEWDQPDELRKLADGIEEGLKVDGSGLSEDSAATTVTYKTAKGQHVTGPAEELTAKLGNPEWGGSYFTFSTENNETIWTFLKKCFERGKIYRGHDVMPWSGRGGSAYSQMEVADGRKLTTHRACFVRFPLVVDREDGTTEARTYGEEKLKEYLLIWTTTPWTLTSNVAAAVNPDLDYVRIKANKDGAVYYFAKDNLNFKRLEKEFKEGFGRPEWNWPENAGKLKTLGQIFKEQGGFEELGTVKGAEMIGWRYAGPFDDLEAQNAEIGSTVGSETGVKAHRVIDGGRDFKGNANVVAGEGTGIVHIAPGCGDVDHKMGVELGLPIIAPLGDDGRYLEGFGVFTGREATDPATVDLVFEELKKKDLVVSIETYPHIYPFCWRTGDELVFRLVDEWFINMDWRDEIKDVTKCINWVPDSIQGQEREIEWLTTMRDWMISKKRFWGLALPIWENPNDPTDFEVIGSLAELKERALNGGEGWEKFEGHTPHRPWIDVVKIRSQKSGALLERVKDVGNPWLDAGIVPFSTMMYNSNREAWKQWFPADLVTECFPGQFRNWFYSMLSLATMMRYDETEDPNEKRPFKNLLGHRLVMNEEGKPMHKSDGTAIWFEEAAEQLGVDTIRWLYLAQNPAADLRFGTRHADVPVTLETVDGPITSTKEGLPTCKVTSKPADDVRRQALIPLWNSYAFFVNYAILDGFDPSLPQVPVQDRPEIDRWVLSRLQELTQTAHDAFDNLKVGDFMNAATVFIDDLSNWYIRRNRRRFWAKKGVSSQTESGASATGSNALNVSPAMATAERLYQKMLSDKDLSMTRERTIIVHEIFSTEEACSPEQLVTRLLGSEEGKRVSRATIYRTLQHLEEAGLLEVLSRSGEAEGPASVTLYRPSLPAGDSPLKPQVSTPTPHSTAETIFRAFLAERKQGLNRDRSTLLREVFATSESFTVEDLLVRLSRYADGKRLHRKDVERGIAQLMEAGLVTQDRNVYSPATPVAASEPSESSSTINPQPSTTSGWTPDKLAAYQTLYEVLLTLSKLLAPCIPFLTERMYRNLAGTKPSSFNPELSSSVHLCDYPTVDASKLDLDLNWKTQQVQTLVRMAHRLRETAELRVRQPLAELRFATHNARQAEALQQHADIIADELNVKLVTRSENLDDLVSYAFKPNLKTLGPKYGKLLNVIRTGLTNVDPSLLAPLRSRESVTLTLEGNEITFAPEDVMVSVQQASDWASADDSGIQIALSTKLTQELIEEGMARDLIRQVQQLRKDADLEENQRISVQWNTDGARELVTAVLNSWQPTILAETRADAIEFVPAPPANGKSVSLGEVSLTLAIVQ